VALALARPATPARHCARQVSQVEARMTDLDYVCFWVIATVVFWLMFCGVLWLVKGENS
jgi:hypothetical protein